MIITKDDIKNIGLENTFTMKTDLQDYDYMYLGKIIGVEGNSIMYNDSYKNRDQYLVKQLNTKEEFSLSMIEGQWFNNRTRTSTIEKFNNGEIVNMYIIANVKTLSIFTKTYCPNIAREEFELLDLSLANKNDYILIETIGTKIKKGSE